MSKVIIKNAVKLALYRDFIKSGVVTNSHGASRVASQLKYYVENTYAHLIAEGIIGINDDDIDSLDQQFLNRQQEEFENAVDELEKSKEEFLRGHAERMAELNSELNKLTKEMTDSSDSIEKNSKILDEQLKKLKNHDRDVQKAKEIEEAQERISKDLDSLLD